MNIRFPFIIAVMACLSVSSCWQKEFEKSIRYLLINDSEYEVVFLVPYNHPKYVSTSLDSVAENDTLLNSWGHIPGIRPYHVRPRSHSNSWYSGYQSLEEFVPLDTLRVFVYDGTQIIGNPDGHIVQEQRYKEEDFFQRYDLTLSDLTFLLDSERQLVLRWPPDSTMKNIKMWPPYETFSKH